MIECFFFSQSIGNVAEIYELFFLYSALKSNITKREIARISVKVTQPEHDFLYWCQKFHFFLLIISCGRFLSYGS